MPIISFIAIFVLATSFAWSSVNENIGNVLSLNIENTNTGQTIPLTVHRIILETNINRDDDGIYAELIYNRAFQGR